MMTRFWLIKLFHSVRVKIIFEGNYIKSVLFCSFFCISHELASLKLIWPKSKGHSHKLIWGLKFLYHQVTTRKAIWVTLGKPSLWERAFCWKKSQIILCICYSVLVLVVYYLFRFSWAWIGLDVLVPLAQLKRRKASAAFLLGCSALMLWNHIPRDSFKQPSILLSN